MFKADKLDEILLRMHVCICEPTNPLDINSHSDECIKNYMKTKKEVVKYIESLKHDSQS